MLRTDILQVSAFRLWCTAYGNGTSRTLSFSSFFCKPEIGLSIRGERNFFFSAKWPKLIRKQEIAWHRNVAIVIRLPKFNQYHTVIASTAKQMFLRLAIPLWKSCLLPLVIAPCTRLIRLIDAVSFNSLFQLQKPKFHKNSKPCIELTGVSG